MGDGIRIYNLFPTLAGTIARWTAELPRIAAMGFDTVYVNPFHEPGFSGSLYAVKDYYRLNPRFRGRARGSDETLLRGFTAAAAGRGLRVMMDLVINHTAKDNPLVTERPHWFAHEADGSVRSPFATDPADPSRKTVWGDLAELDYQPPQQDEIVAFFGEVVAHYIGLGFTGFRCDAAYKVPATAWRALIDAARRRAPDLVFCAENLGAPQEAVLALAGAGFDYLFNSAKWWDFESPWLLDQYEAFRHIAPSIAFPESHDTDRLVADLLAAGYAEDQILPRYRQAYAFAATFSAGVMMPMGFEYGWSRRLDVVAGGAGEPEAPRFDLSGFIAEINALKAAVPALRQEGPQRLLTVPGDPLVALLRQDASGIERVLIAINSDDREPRTIERARLAAAAGIAAGARRELADLTPRALRPQAPGDGGVLTVPPLGMALLRASLRRAPASPLPATRSTDTAAHHPQWRPDPRVLIEAVYPEIDCGRYPVKRVYGDEFAVWADLFRDGHDKIRAVCRYAADGDPWREAEFAFFDNDRWVARFALDKVGRWRYTIDAWTDRFASWCEEVEKKRDAGQALDVEYQEGRDLVAAAAAGAAEGEAAVLRRALAESGGETAGAGVERLLAAPVRTAMAVADARSGLVSYRHELEIIVDRPAAGFAAWYEMFPRSQGRVPGQSATFDDCIARLGEIAALGFDVVYLVPIHPIGRTNRKGRDNAVVAAPGDPGSPYAIGAAEGGHRAIHPDLGTLADFRRFVAAAAALGLEVALDFAVQCAPDHPWVREHRQWFSYRPDGTIKYAENPPKKYEDIVNVEFDNPDRDGLWHELRDTVLFWVGQGVSTFRVDNPHTKPVAFWEWLIREVKARCPGAVFLAEAFTRPKMMRALAKAGFTQSYTYFTWRNTRAELTEYMTELTRGPQREYFCPNFFTNTPDILPVPLQEGGRPAFRTRLVLAATLSTVYGIYNGFELCENTAIPGREEYLNSEKYEYKVWDWDRPGNIKADIALVNAARRDNPALQQSGTLRFLDCDNPDVIAYAKAADLAGGGRNVALVVVNLDPRRTQHATVVVRAGDLGLADDRPLVFDELFTGATIRWDAPDYRFTLDPQTNPSAILILNADPPP